MLIWAAVIDVDCGVDYPTSAHLVSPRRDTGVPLRYLVMSWTSCCPTGDCASAALRAADECDWLQSSFINGIYRLSCGLLTFLPGVREVRGEHGDHQVGEQRGEQGRPGATAAEDFHRPAVGRPVPSGIALRECDGACLCCEILCTTSHPLGGP